MKNQLKEQWLTVPVWIRKPVIFMVGLFFIVAAALTGWLPGPGGIPLFLVGIAILSTEFVWAKRVKDVVLKLFYACRDWYREHRQLGIILLASATVIGMIVLYVMIRRVFHL